MARGDSINSLLQMQAYRRAEMEGTIAKRDVYGETKNFVETWRKNNGLEGTKALPPRNEVPFQWMLPFLDKVETQDTVPSPIANEGMIANFLAPSGTGKTLSDEWYEKGLETILETTEPGSWQRRERLNILEHQYLDQVNNPAMKIATHDKPLFKTPPATGAGADNIAPDWLIDYMNRKDENLLQTQDRLRRA